MQFVDTSLKVPDNAPRRKSGRLLIFGGDAEGTMGLEDDLKARTSALISQQMANWVVEIQRAIQSHQAALVSALDELGENVARYDEKVDETAIAQAMAEVVAQQPPAAGADYAGLKASIAAIEKGANLSEVLTQLMGEVSRHVERAAMFIVKNNAAVGWNARGFDHPEAIKAVTIPLTADTVLRLAHGSRSATRGHASHSPATAQALARLGGAPQGVLAIPLILRDKVAAILYCDSTQDELPAATADLLEVLVLFAGKVIDILSTAPKAPGATLGTSPGVRPAGPAMPGPDSSTGGAGLHLGTLRPQAAPAAAPAPQPAPTPAPARPRTAPPLRAPAAFTPAPAAAAPAAAPALAPARTALAPEEQKAHEDAKRFARLVVSEIKLYNEAKVTEGRKTRDIYERLKEDIERGRQMYMDRVPAPVRDASDYFQDELVRILAGGDAAALGPQ
jgi:hypothetical protein